MASRAEHSTITGRVLEIQRMSTEDGPGIRTTVFMKGCPLRCSWCHNPESISPSPQVQWIASRCIGCRMCEHLCPREALTIGGSGEIIINRDRCRGCGTCVDACPTTALELLGRLWTVDELVTELLKDRSYFEKSGGGITVSGGESTMQPEFIIALLRELREQGIHTALDTCGLCREDSLRDILPHTDLVLYDLKEINPEKHLLFTGSSNEKILANLHVTAEYVREHMFPGELWIRTPVIPGATDRDDNIRGIGECIAALREGSVARWELCAFNNLCGDKYTRLGREWEFAHTPLLTTGQIEHLTYIA
ncbi:MAG TPA: glycyl-radical enzyme activating protein, partial [Spirochaetota bacterium]|nr:glycyl-radical enzyme activating protein [Spirochaetota bacterium]